MNDPGDFLYENPPVVGRMVERSGRLASRGETLNRIDRKNRRPLSFAQERLWHLDQLEHDRSAYNRPAGWWLRGRLDSKALGRALEAIVQRHEPLRSTFSVIDEKLVQVVRAATHFDLPIQDLASLDEKKQKEEIFKKFQDESERPFNLERDQLLRASLLRLGDEEHVLLLTTHHIASDAWSWNVLWRELTIRYEAYCRGADTVIPELTVRYADYATWQRNTLKGEGLERLLAYWRKQLEGLVPLELPTVRPRQRRPSRRGVRHDFTIEPELVQSLQSLGQDEGVTLNTTLLAAFQTLLARYTGQKDIAVGTPITSRNHPQLEKLIGFFVNTLLIRLDLSGDPTFRELLGRVQKVTRDACDHQDLPLESLIDELDPKKESLHPPLVQVLFSFSSDRQEDLAPVDLEVSRLQPRDQGVWVDLEMHLCQLPEKILGDLVYNTDLFDADTISRTIEHFQTLLESIVRDADVPISRLAVLTKREKHQILTEWNDTFTDIPKDTTLVDIFEQQVDRTPDDIALVSKNERVTYRELNDRANRLAGYISRAGGGPERTVGCFTERSPDMIASLLGILKAGAAYLPLDPSYPADRLRFMIEDAGCSLLLTSSRLEQSLPSREVDRILVDREQEPHWGSEVGAPKSQREASRPAYVMYTSGSTGRPKGVVISHRAVVNFLMSMAKSPGIRASDVLLSVTTLSFDISVLEFFLPLTVGAKVVIAEPDDVVDDRRLVALMDHHDVTVMQATPATWILLLEGGWKGDPKLKILCGGEALTENMAADLLNRCHELWNMYGPTETTVWSTIARISNKTRVTIGRPIANTQVYILDPNLAPLPIGVPGELHIGGDGLGLGYWNRAELTSERFIENPFDSTGETRLYKTGDRARFLPDGRIECLGRIDRQVKLRGYRIELGEIEAVLLRHPTIFQAAAIVREHRDAPSDRRLIAYYATRAGKSVVTHELYRWLKESLPNAMVPAELVSMEKLPLTPNGKIDRKALPEPSRGRPGEGIVGTPPKDQLERNLTRLWKEILRKESIGIHDNFFDIGGESLLAAQMFRQMEKVVGQSLPLATFFEAPSIRQLADLIRKGDWTGRWSSLVEIQPAGFRPPFFCVHGAGGNVLLYRDLARHMGPDQPVYALQSRGLDGDEPFLKTIEEMAAHYVSQIRAVQPEGPYRLGGYCMGGTVAFEMAQQLHRQGQEVCFLALLETYNMRFGKLRPTFGRQLAWSVKAHVRNLSLLDTKGKMVFLSSKVEVALRRSRRIFGALSAKIFGQRKYRHRRLAAVHMDLKRSNDRAQASYQPKEYPGKISLFRPEESRLGNVNPEFGWGELAAGGVDVHSFPIFPRAILTEPFVHQLGEQLNQCLTRVKDS